MRSRSGSAIWERVTMIMGTSGSFDANGVEKKRARGYPRALSTGRFRRRSSALTPAAAARGRVAVVIQRGGGETSVHGQRELVERPRTVKSGRSSSNEIVPGRHVRPLARGSC